MAEDANPGRGGVGLRQQGRFRCWWFLVVSFIYIAVPLGTGSSVFLKVGGWLFDSWPPSYITVCSFSFSTHILTGRGQIRLHLMNKSRRITSLSLAVENLRTSLDV